MKQDKLNTLNITGLLVLGGKSERFTQEKALAIYNQKTFLEIALEKMMKFCSHIILSVNNSNNSKDLLKVVSSIKSNSINSLEVIEDDVTIDANGPLKGILTCIHHIKTDTILVLPIDMPLISEIDISRLLEITTDNVICSYNINNKYLTNIFFSCKTYDLKITLSKIQLSKRNNIIDIYRLFPKVLLYKINALNCQFINVNHKKELINLKNYKYSNPVDKEIIMNIPLIDNDFGVLRNANQFANETTKWSIKHVRHQIYLHAKQSLSNNEFNEFISLIKKI
ncbi:MAG: molybdenum cofactor guanylyltransferase [Candidatus Heimdallarchaeota archaeon]|nr:molybdenum cofactor guanylyltransferase [Candidatus Heimdallarchaeota archaeon]MDH5648005.1 molybdenum cofactor guanylyltransferase [Candidatus Heimdallarchaeota archaeon]